MKTIKLCGVALLASALAACGGASDFGDAFNSSSSFSSVVESSAEASSSNADVSSSEAVSSSEGQSSSEAVSSSSEASSSSVVSTEGWTVYDGNHHPMATGAVILPDAETLTQFEVNNDVPTGADYFTVNGGGTVAFDSSTSGSNRLYARLDNVVGEGYPKHFTLLAGVTGNSNNIRVLEIEMAFADAGAAGSRLKAILRADGSNKGVQLEQANNGNSVNAYGLDMSGFRVYQISVTMHSATNGDVRVYIAGDDNPLIALNGVTMRDTIADGDNYVRIGDGGSHAYKAELDWVMWTKLGAYSPSDLAGQVPGNVGCVIGYGASDDYADCAIPPAISSSSDSVGSSSSAGTSSSSSGGTGAVPDPSMRGFATLNGGTTGGAGGEVVTVSNYADLASYLQDGDHTPRVIQISGTITAPGSAGHMLRVPSNKTIIGLGTDAAIEGFGFDLNGWNSAVIAQYGRTCEPQNEHNFTPTTNVIIRNLTFKYAGDDSINMQCYTRNVWIDHNTFERVADGSVDVKRGSDFVTISWNRFIGTYKTSLVGHADNRAHQDTGKLRVTYHHNWFDNTDSRNPRVRFGQVHVFNNFADTITDYFVGAGFESSIHADGNYVNWANRTTKDYKGTRLTWEDSNMVIDEAHDLFLGDGPGFNPSDYYEYELDNAADVPGLVMENAGAGKLD